MQIKEQIAKLVRLYIQEQSLAEEVKEVKDAIKAGGGNAAIAAAVAKAIAGNKVDDLKAKAEDTVDLIELSRS